MNVMCVVNLALRNWMGEGILISWTLIENDWIVSEGPIDLIIAVIKAKGDNFILRVDVKKTTIEIVGYKTEVDRSEQIRKGIRESQIKKFRRYPNFIEDPEYKFCTGCKSSFKLDHFGFNKNSPDGRNRRCKQCVNNEAKKRYKKRKGDKK